MGDLVSGMFIDDILKMSDNVARGIARTSDNLAGLSNNTVRLLDDLARQGIRQGDETARSVWEMITGRPLATANGAPVSGSWLDNSAQQADDFATHFAKHADEGDDILGSSPQAYNRFAVPDDIDSNAISFYDNVYNQTQQEADLFIDQISANTGIDPNVIATAREHMFITEHNLINPNTGEMVLGNFSPNHTNRDLWEKALTGDLDEGDLNRFQRLMAHEYVESILMEAGLPYKENLIDGTFWPGFDADTLSVLHNTNDSFRQYDRLGLPRPETDFDLENLTSSNLNELAKEILEIYNNR